MLVGLAVGGRSANTISSFAFSNAFNWTSSFAHLSGIVCLDSMSALPDAVKVIPSTLSVLSAFSRSLTAVSVSDEDITAIVIFTAGPLVSRRLLLLLLLLLLPELLLLLLLLLPEPLPVVGVRVGEAVGAAVAGI